MSGEIDRLEVKIEAEASKANSQLDLLVKKLEKMASSLEGVSGNGVSQMAMGLESLSDSMLSLQNVSSRDFSRIATNIDKLGRVKSGNISNVSAALKSFSSSMGTLSTTSVPNFENFAGLTEMATAFRKFGLKTATGATKNMPDLANGLRDIKSSIDGLSGIEEKANQITDLAKGISQLGYERVNKAVENIPKVTKSLEKMIHTLAKAPVVSNNTVRLVMAVARLSNNMRSVGSSSRRASSGLNLFSRSAGKARSKSHSLAATFGKLYASYFLVIRGIKALGNAINSSLDYSETLNYFNVTMGKIGKEFGKEYKKHGYDSAESYAESFGKRLNSLNEKLTGYAQNASGSLQLLGTKNLGLDPDVVMDYQATISSLTNALGLSGETSNQASRAFTMLAGDMSSLKNEDMSKVTDNFQSGLTGMSKAVDKYGMDIRMATLQQIAYENGVKANVSTMSQASKVQLRMIAMLQQSKVAWGDLANTINSTSNQIRMLKTGMSNLGRSIGDLFQPIVAGIMPYLNALVIMLQRFVVYIGQITGLKDALDGINKSVGSVPDNGLSELLDDSSESADNASKATKKLKKSLDLLSFDKINKLSDTSEGDKDKDKKKNIDFDFSGALSKEILNYEEVWGEAFASMENKANQIAEKMIKAIKKGWKKGNFTFLGKGLAKKLNHAMRKMNWAKIKKTTNKVAKSLATFLNGFTAETDWTLLGETIAEGFNTATEFLYTFVKKFDFLEFGKKVSEGLNSAVRNYNWETLGSTLGSSLRGVIQFAFGTITEFEFTGLGKKIGDGINAFLKDMGKIDKRTGLTGWQELGKSLSSGASGILDSINAAFEVVNWDEVGKAVGDFLKSIDWGKIMLGVGKLIGTALVASVKVWISGFKADPLATLFITTLAAAFTVKKMGAIGMRLASYFGSDAFAKTTASKVSSSKFGKLISGKLGSISLAAGVAFISFNFTKGVFDNIFDGANVKEVQAAFQQMFEDAFKLLKFTNLFVLVADKITGGESTKLLAKAFADWFTAVGALFTGEYKWKEWSDGIQNAIAGTWFGKEILGVKHTADYKKQSDNKVRASVESGEAEEIVRKMDKLKALEQKMKANTAIRSEVNEAFKLHKELKAMSYSENELEKIYKEYKAKTVSVYGSKSYKGGSETNNRKTITSTGEYRKTTLELSKAMKKLNIPSDKQSGYIKTLKEGLEKGTISMKDYKKIVDNSTGSSKALGKAINNVKSKNAKVSVTTTGGKDVTGLVNAVKSVPISKTSTVTGKTEGVNTIADFRSKFDAVPTSKTFTVTAKTSGKNTLDEMATAMNKLKNKRVEIGLKLPPKGEVNKRLKEIEGRFALAIPVKFGFKTLEAKNKEIKLIKKTVPPGLQGNLIDFIEKMPLIEGFASGGYPNTGEMFLARENGIPELVGRIGNQTAVANNDQITDALEQAAFRGVARAMVAAGGGNGGKVSVEIAADEKGMFKVIQKEAKIYKGQTGRHAFQ